MEPAVRGARTQSGIAAAPARSRSALGLKVGIPGAERSNLALNHGRRERNFWMQRRSAKNRHSNARTPAETKMRELSGRKSPQKRAIRRRAGNARFAETEWWAHQGSNLGPAD